VVSAQVSFLEDWRFTGFGTLGYAQSDKYSDLVLKRNIFQRSQTIEDNAWLVDSRLGLQASKELRVHWDFVGQIVMQEKVDNTPENSIEMAFVRYQLNDAWSFRLGRLVNDTFLLSDHRNVGYSYHWVRPPSEFYGWIPFAHYDGFKASFEVGDFDHFFRLEAFVGKGAAKVNIGYGDGGTSFNHVKANPMLGTSVTWEKDDLTLRGNYARLHVADEIAAAEELNEFVSSPAIQSAWPQAQQIAQDYGLKDSNFTYQSLGFRWLPGPWVVQGEVSDITSTSFGTYGGQRAYLHLGHRFGQLLPHITYSRSWDGRDYPYDPAPPTPNTLPAGTIEGLEVLLVNNRLSGVVRQYTVSIGLRWDFSSQRALKLQCDRINLHQDSLGIYPTTETELANRQESTRSWCSTTIDWIF